MEWTRTEIILALKTYVEIRDNGMDQGAAIGRLANLLGRRREAVEAAVLAPAKEDPDWNNDRPFRGLTNKEARLLWEMYRLDIPGLMTAASLCEKEVRRSRR